MRTLWEELGFLSFFQVPHFFLLLLQCSSFFWYRLSCLKAKKIKPLFSFCRSLLLFFFPNFKNNLIENCLLLRLFARRWELFAPVKLWIAWQNFVLEQMWFFPLLYFLDQIVDYRKVDSMVVQLHKLLCVFLQSVAPNWGKWVTYKWLLGSNARFSNGWSALHGHVKKNKLPMQAAECHRNSNASWAWEL